ncbi:APC family permease [Candidatus Pseudoscillospira sp. SGI.172]|uniref:APC family permease n=1 Tax=Candidatus Pseudoscillospira sp. SGI.172 TaxID=3420582 RepID=UPI002A7C343C|nr:APC family permease [Pseudoflavonifractor sp.]MDY3018952.1 APC family permease [Oscillospiraceae bacterium]
MDKKKFRLTDVILSVICVVFVAEAAAPVAALGNSQYFWWIFMMIAFLVPYGLIASELGTTYQGDGGLYDWINKAFPGTKWGARASWYYWVNFPLWMASLAVMCPGLITLITGWEMGPFAAIVIELAFVWLVTLIACYPVCDNIMILNIAAVIKVFLAILVGVMGVWYVIRNGFVNNMAPRTFLPSFDLRSLSFISVIIFNFLGFEIVCTYSDSMSDPKKQIPQAIVAGGIVIAAIYLFSGFGIGAAIPTAEISSDSGLIDAVALISGQTGGLLIGGVALLFLVTLFGNMISWSMGVNSTAAYAADNGDMPRVFTRRWSKNDMPVGSAVMSGIVASLVCLLGVFMDLFFPDSSLFWSFFALNLVMFLLSYLPVFPAFLRLRKIDPDTPRPFRVPGGDGWLAVLAWVPMVLIVISILFTGVPLTAEEVSEKAPILIGSLIFLALGEILIALRGGKKHAN